MSANLTRIQSDDFCTGDLPLPEEMMISLWFLFSTFYQFLTPAKNFSSYLIAAYVLTVDSLEDSS